MKNDTSGKTYRVDAHFVCTSMNGNVYSRDEIAKAISTLPGKHVDLNHNLDWKIDGVDILAAALENDAAELLLHVNNGVQDAKGRDVQQAIETEEIDCVSIEANAGYIIQTEEGDELCGLEYTGLGLLDQDALPGIPLTRIMALENVMEGIFEAVDNPPKTDAERAMTHFRLTPERWNALSDQEKQSLIDRLPPRKEASNFKTVTGKEDEPTQSEVKNKMSENPTQDPKIEQTSPEQKKVEADLQEKIIEVDSLKQKLVEERLKTEDLNEKLSEKDSKLGAQIEKLTELQKRNDSLDTTVSELRAKKKELDGRLRETEQRITDRDKRVDSLEIDLDKLREDISRATAEKENAVTEMNKAVAKASEKSMLATKETEARAKIQVELAEVRKSLAQAIREQANIAEKSSDDAGRIADLENEIAVLKEERKKLNDLALEWQTQHQKAMNENKRLHKIQRSYGIAEVDKDGNIIV